MRTIAPLNFTFVYVNTPTSEACVRNAYRRLLAIAERNLIAKGLLGPTIHNDIENEEKHIVDGVHRDDYSETNNVGGIINNKGSGGKTEAFKGDSFPDDKEGGDPSGQSGNGLENK